MKILSMMFPTFDDGMQVKLTQLDLSFNNISSICGLQKLTALQDISLFSNNISSFEGLEPLSQLCALSMGTEPFSEHAVCTFGFPASWPGDR